MKKTLIALISAAFCLMNVFASETLSDGLPYDLEGIITPETYAEVKENGYALKEYKNKEECKYLLLPNTPFCNDASKSWEKNGKNENPIYSLEKLFLVQKEDFKVDGVPAGIQEISEVLRKFSEMEGMQYYSNSSKKMETLYKKAYAIDSLEEKNKVPDNTEGSADGQEIFGYVHDNSFKDCFYKINYYQNEKEFRQCYTIAKDIWVGVFRGIKPGFMKINVIISECENQFIVYFLVQSRYAAPGLMEKKISRSLKSRINAISLWFFGHFDEVDGKNIAYKFENVVPQNQDEGTDEFDKNSED